MLLPLRAKDLPSATIAAEALACCAHVPLERGLTTTLHLKLIGTRGREEHCRTHSCMRLIAIGSKRREFGQNKEVERSIIRSLENPYHGPETMSEGTRWVVGSSEASLVSWCENSMNSVASVS